MCDDIGFVCSLCYKAMVFGLDNFLYEIKHIVFDTNFFFP